jgi:hypothetical protein
MGYLHVDLGVFCRHFRCIFYDLVSQFTGGSQEQLVSFLLATDFQSLIKRDKYLCNLPPREGGKLLAGYINLSSIHCGQKLERSEVMLYILERKLPLRLKPPLYKFVINHMTSMAGSNRSAMSSEMHKNAAKKPLLEDTTGLLEHARTQPWMYNDKKQFESKLTSGQFQYALAVSMDDQLAMEVVSDLYGVSSVSVHGMNAIQLAAVCNSYFIVNRKYLKFTRADLYANGQNAVHLAVRHNAAHVAVHLVARFGNKCIADVISEYYSMTDSAIQRVIWNAGALKIQRTFRRFRVSKRFGLYLKKNFQVWLRFRSVWGPVLIGIRAAIPQALSWSTIKLRFDIIATPDHDDDVAAITSGVLGMSSVDVSVETSDVVLAASGTTQPVAVESETIQQLPVTNIELSQAALKWFSGADGTYQHLFQSRLTSLADGYRSYALSKRLKHCSFPMYETKLDSGQRMLWTKVLRDDRESILVSVCLNRHSVMSVFFT